MMIKTTKSIFLLLHLESDLTITSVDSYPTVLQKMFREKNIQVENFGIGVSMIRFGKPNVWQELDKIKTYLLNVVIIILGTNETVGANRHNWEHISDFEDYIDFLSQLKSLSSHPVVFNCSPPGMNLKTPDLSQERIQDLAFKNKLKLITPTDDVHPNKQGYQFLAKLIFEKIRKAII